MTRAAVCLAVFLLLVLASAASDTLTDVQQPHQVSHGATVEETKHLPVVQQGDGREEEEVDKVAKAVAGGQRDGGELVSSESAKEGGQKHASAYQSVIAAPNRTEQNCSNGTQPITYLPI
ncbi:hypothetical protein ABZP36_013374 [Zizania latifolia]